MGGDEDRTKLRLYKVENRYISSTGTKFRKCRFFVSWLRWHHMCFNLIKIGSKLFTQQILGSDFDENACVSAEQRQRSRKKLQIARIANWDCIPRYLRRLIRACAVCSSKILPFFASFGKKYIVRPHMLIWFFKCNNRLFVPWLNSSTHVQIVHTCLPGTSDGKSYTLYAFHYMK